MSIKAYFGAVAAIGFLAAGAAPAGAGVLFSDLGPGQSYDCCSGWTVSGSSSTLGQSLVSASEFTAAKGGAVGAIDVAIGHISGTNGATVSLWTDNAGALGSQLGSWDVSGLATFGSTGSGSLADITGVKGVSLVAGKSYFLQLSSPSDTWDAWNFNSVGQSSKLIQNGQDFGPQATGAFQVLSSAPEPAAWAMMVLGVGMVGAGLRLQARRQTPASLAV